MKTLLPAIFLYLCIGTVTAAVTDRPELPQAERGVLDLRGWDFVAHGPATLDGRWEFYWEQLLLPGQFKDSHVTAPDYFDILSLWNDHYTSSTQLKGQGFATYHLRLRVPKSDYLLALELPDMYCSYALWIDGEKLAANGVVGTRRKETTPQWMPQTIAFKPKRSTVDIVLQVANFTHYRGGMNDHIYIGEANQMFARRESEVITNTVLTGGLGLIGCFFVILFLFFKKDRAALYYAALCITWAIRSVFSNLYLFIKTFPGFDWELGAKIEYLTLYLTMMLAILFISKMFPHDEWKPARRVLIGINVMFMAITVATPALVYTQMLNFYLMLCWAFLGYIAYIVLRALVFGRAGAAFTAISILLAVAMFTYDILTFRNVFDFNPVLFSIGYMTIFFLNATAIAYQLSITEPRRAEEQLTYDEVKM